MTSLKTCCFIVTIADKIDKLDKRKMESRELRRFMVESVETLLISEIKKGLILNYCGYCLCNLHTVRVHSIWHSKLCRQICCC